MFGRSDSGEAVHELLDSLADRPHLGVRLGVIDSRDAFQDRGQPGEHGRELGLRLRPQEPRVEEPPVDSAGDGSGAMLAVPL